MPGDQLPHDSLQDHPIRPRPARRCVPARHATARCPDQTIVTVLVRLALFPCDTDNRRGRKHIGTAQQSAGQTTVFSAAAHNSVERERGWDQTSRHIEPLRPWPGPSSPISSAPGGVPRHRARPRALVPKGPHETSAPWRAELFGRVACPRSFDFSGLSPSRVSNQRAGSKQRRRDRQLCGGRTNPRVLLANTLGREGGPAKLLETGRVTAGTCVVCAYAPCHRRHFAAEQLLSSKASRARLEAGEPSTLLLAQILLTGR